MRDLLASLRDHPMAMLRVIAELHDVDLTTNARDDASAQLASVLQEGDIVAHALARCSPSARAAWDALATAGGRMKLPVFARRFGALRPVGPGKLEREMPWREPANPTEELWYSGLIYRGFADTGSGPAEYFYIPHDLLSASPGGKGNLVDRPAPELLPAEPEPPEGRRAPLLAIDACTLLAELADNPLRVDAGGTWRSSDEARLREMLLLQDPVRFAMLVTLARELGWLAVESKAGKLAVQGDRVGEWLRASPWEQRTAFFNAWRDGVDWNDLRRMPSVRAEGEWRNDPRLARGAILGALGKLRPGRWYSTSDIVGWIKETDPDFQRPDGNYGGWYLRDAATGRYLSGFESWDEVEGRLIYFIISEPLFWLDAVELGVTDEPRRELFRLSQAGSAWICDGTPPELAAPAKLKVGDDFTITAPTTLPLIDRYRLLRFTEPVQGTPEPVQSTTHRISRRSLARARAGGLKGDRILQFLRHASGGRVPVRVETAVERWQQHGGAVRVTRGAVLRVEDAGVLATIRADATLAPLLGELISAQAVMVPAGNVTRLLAALTELGYSATVDG